MYIGNSNAVGNRFTLTFGWTILPWRRPIQQATQHSAFEKIPSHHVTLNDCDAAILLSAFLIDIIYWLPGVSLNVDLPNAISPNGISPNVNLPNGSTNSLCF